MITLDTSGVLAALNRADPDHAHARQALESEHGPLIVPAGILAEAGYMIEADLGAAVLRRFVADLADGFYDLDCGAGDFERVGALLDRYADLRLGIADACVVACAERNAGRVLTFDHRDFAPVAREGTISIVPALA
ncbi:MAG: PIN domain-containing protein [Actinomycetota bacterium]|nr:PIN domain-containing protein [Actinomycetota bacterium]